jgi:hypothetical protein
MAASSKQQQQKQQAGGLPPPEALHTPSVPLPAGYASRMNRLHLRALTGLLASGAVVAAACGAYALLAFACGAWPYMLAVEAAFYLFAWRARVKELSKVPESHAPEGHDPLELISRFEASAHVIKRTASSYDIIGLWHHNAPFEALTRGNVRELLAWGFGYKSA